ncbi:nuclear transport factor 2 family protein [Nocardia cyriacigeorgica]|uniref:nuclear transport factor 2 family protein n=1 Tax=Nocardia cyriacigeorgica TaxID=135487 RepID=UPI002458515E|nr:nuclear transport factor 2 family protein [Nocardia cyriacigeorgica]
MSLDASDASLLAAVQASPHAVAAHDRPTWVGLFTADATVRDPVGARPHIGRAAIERFYDTFIAPNTIEFRVDHDFLGPASVVRDLSIRTTMSTGACVLVPMHLRYDLAEVDGGLRITHLAAHWELPAMVAQLLRTGARGFGAGMKLGAALVRNQGVGGAAGMARGFTGVGRTGKRVAAELFQAAGSGDTAHVRRLLGAGTVIECPVGTVVSADEFTDWASVGLRAGKTIAAGRTVTVSVERGGAPALVTLDFAADAPRIHTVGVFTERVPVQG